MKEVIIKIEGQEWKDALDKAYKKVSKTAKIVKMINSYKEE